MLIVYARLCIYVPVHANSGRSILSCFYGIRVFIVLPNFRCITMPSTCLVCSHTKGKEMCRCIGCQLILSKDSNG